MNLPSFLFGLVFSSLLAALFHLFVGGSVWKLILLMVSAWISFFAGNWIANSIGFEFDKLGELHIGMASTMCFTALALINWLVRTPTTDKRR